MSFIFLFLLSLFPSFWEGRLAFLLVYLHADDAKSKEEPAQSLERANPLTSEEGVPIAFTRSLCFNESMAKLDSDDLKAIKGLIEVTIDEKELVTKSDISHLPTKDEFYTKMDKVMGELKTIREEQTLQCQHLTDHEDRIQKVEPHLGISSD